MKTNIKIMAMKYDYLALETDEDRHATSYEVSPINQLAAASFVASLFTSHSIPFAFIGGFAMRLRGSPRFTEDIDVCVQTTMLQLWKITEPEQRYVWSQSPRH